MSSSLRIWVLLLLAIAAANAQRDLVHPGISKLPAKANRYALLIGVDPI